MVSLAPISEDSSFAKAANPRMSMQDMRDKYKVTTKTKAPRVTFINAFYKDQEKSKTDIIAEQNKPVEEEKIIVPPPDVMLFHAVDNFSKTLPFVYILHITGSITYFLWGGLTALEYLFINHSLALLLIIDAYTSYDQWKFMFGPERMDAVAQRKGEGRIPDKPTLRRRTDLHRPSQINEASPTKSQLSERSKVGIVNFSHYHLSFFNYFYLFKMRLRFDFVLNAARNLIRHKIICSLINSGLYPKAYRYYPLYQKHWDKGPRACIGESCLETTIMLGLSELDEIKKTATFKYSNWVACCNIEPDKIMSIDLMTIVVDLDTRMCTYCEVNGEEWKDMREVLQLQYMLITGYYHPVVHLYANWFYTDNAADSCYHWGLLTLITNSVSFWGGTIAAGYDDPEPWRKILLRNALKGLHFHYVEDLQKFSKYSKTGRFLLEARKLCKKHCAHQRPGDDHFYEAFFIACVLHNIDHAQMSRMNNPADMDYLGPHELTSSELIRVMFCVPHDEMFITSSFRRVQIPWVQDLYRELKKLDQTLADNCHLGIRF